MKTGGFSWLCVGVMLFPASLRAQSDLADRVQQLEKRVAELEAALKRSALPKSESENKLIGAWTAVEADKGAAVFVDLVFKHDGKCDAVIRSFGARPNAKYKVIGKQLIVESSTDAATESWGQCRIVSVNDKELVLEHGEGPATRKIKYDREK